MNAVQDEIISAVDKTVLERVLLESFRRMWFSTRGPGPSRGLISKRVANVTVGQG